MSLTGEYAQKYGGSLVGALEKPEPGAPARKVTRPPGRAGQSAVASTAVPPASMDSVEPGRLTLPRAAAIACAVLLVVAGWCVRQGGYYSSGKGLGYALGIAGGSMLLVMLLYPVRKHFRSMQCLGSLKHWFRFHMIAGIVGPVLVLFHSTFQIGSVNAGVALACMLLVVTSGLVGRFLYRRIHHGLYGTHATLKELQQALAQQLVSLESVLRLMPLVKDEVDRFAGSVSAKPEGLVQRGAHFLTLGWRRFQARRRVRAAITAYVTPDDGHSVLPHGNLTGLLATIDAALGAAQRAAQFSTYERLFSLWHVVHIPFLCLLVLTALVHVVAVHVY